MRTLLGVGVCGDSNAQLEVEGTEEAYTRRAVQAAASLQRLG